ncbi:GDP-4-dehydro-6-deoxy-D-mannose reductase [Hasllibacter halocynthiae]|uniref:GDP-4-dehydro-6-deoxy-D-mannose reductase n=1 Tax=Hasllibacter halocynthiae TaxID=595589 RepID=A0A2T0X1K0_9RHOB|nr:NAD-dependent epimerase/dehydratase family protein [Hasllibacter halocynthiae]PRY92818.1 GDP-4-dehydro-6-deoxy-D-mannose reductase [Hasllibacter halocynthiae]
MTAPVILVIGAAGFVGSHLVTALRARYGEAAVISAGRGMRSGNGKALDVTDGAAIHAAIDAYAPTDVVNLAGLAAPAEAARLERAAWNLHVHAAADLGEVLLKRRPEARLIHIGSGLAYGRTALHGRPVREDEPLEPMDTYGVTKAAGDLALGALAGRGLRVVRMRPFNHTGAGQRTGFAVPAFAAQIAEIEAGAKEPVLDVGNLDAARDFLHVSDVVDAYATVIDAGDAVTDGRALNVASGRAVPMREVLSRLLALSEREITVQQDPARQRPSDLPTVAGDAAALHGVTGWQPRATLDDALHDVLEHERAKLRR